MFSEKIENSRSILNEWQQKVPDDLSDSLKKINRAELSAMEQIVELIPMIETMYIRIHDTQVHESSWTVPSVYTYV